MDRRAFLTSSAAAAVAASIPTHAFAQAGDAGLDALFDAIFADNLQRSPEQATSLGMDKGVNAPLKHKLSDRSTATTERDLAATRAWIAKLEAVDRASLPLAAALNLDVILYSMKSRTVSWDRFRLEGAQRPYRISQQTGAYFNVPDFLNSTHSIATADDCEAYLDRLAQFPNILDEETQLQREDAARGYLAPGWSLDLALVQIGKLRGAPAAQSGMTQSLARRAAAKGIAGDWQARAAGIVDKHVYPAIDRQIAMIHELRPTASTMDGFWRLPHGDEIYAVALQQATTTKYTPAEVHKMGLDQVASISADLDTLLKQQGFTQGSVGERLSALNADPRQLYTDSPEGRAALLASLNGLVKDMYGRLPRDFADIPTTPLEIRAVPVEIQDGAPNGYYQRGALDGSRPAIYFINLKDVHDWPKFGLPTLTYHEGIPGHHLQISTAQESKDIPLLRKASGNFSAYTEGWALYAEQLGGELGAYDHDPLGRVGFLQSFLFRAARLVVDTGIHTQRWSRLQATDYLVQVTGFARPRNQREVERYITWGGQACSYKVGHMAWISARTRAQKALGPRFDIREYHKIIRDGVMPLTILDQRIDARIAAAMKA